MEERNQTGLLEVEETDNTVLANAITRAAELNHRATQSIARSILHLSQSIRQFTDKLPPRGPRAGFN